MRFETGRDKDGRNVYLYIGHIGKVETRYVGARNSKVTNLSCVDESGEFTNLKCWGKHATRAEGLQSGDSVVAIATLEIKEWNGKTYENYNVLDFITSRVGGFSGSSDGRQSYSNRKGEGKLLDELTDNTSDDVPF